MLGLAKGYLLGNAWNPNLEGINGLATITMCQAVESALAFVGAGEDVACDVWVLLEKVSNAQNMGDWERYEHRVFDDVLGLLDRAMGRDSDG